MVLQPKKCTKCVTAFKNKFMPRRKYDEDGWNAGYDNGYPSPEEAPDWWEDDDDGYNSGRDSSDEEEEW